MSTDMHKGGDPQRHTSDGAPFHHSVTFEPRDINVATVVKQLIYLGITIVIALLICIPIIKFLSGMAADSDTPMAPVRAQMSRADREEKALPPEPRLQGVPGHEKDPQQDLRDKIAADTQANESTGWVDQSRGIAKIPVKDAMKIIAERNGAALAGGAPAEEKRK